MIRLSALLAASSLALSPAAAQRVAIGAPSDAVEGPELGRTGNHAVGTRLIDMALPPRVQLTAAGASEAARSVGVRFWYPAAASGGRPATYRHRMAFPDKSTLDVAETGIASEGAAVAKGRFPLVLISHGLGGWSEHLSRLGEHLASHGYVVASIDHRDMRFDSVPAFLLSFGNVLKDRSLDQQQVLARLLNPKSAPAPMAAVDRERIGLIGYSMGGYGALATAGAAYDPAAAAFGQLPGPARDLVTSSDPGTAAQIDALVLFAPWGGQPNNRAWSADGLAKLRAPTLLIAGDHDDIVDYKGGVRWLFEGLKGADRRLLVYREARHNVAGNAVDLGRDPTVEAIGYAREPVWRMERINRINQHFVTAFLDAALKGDTAKARYLDVPTPVASDGEWPVAFGERDAGALAGDGQPRYWRGFPRRWSTGLELHRKGAGR